MFPSFLVLRRQLSGIIKEKGAQGHQIEGLEVELEGMADSYDGMQGFAEKLSSLPIRSDWKYEEPNELEAIWKACDPNRPLGSIKEISVEESARKVEAAFLASVCGCQLGKPIEVNPSLAELKAAGEKIGEWPINDYISMPFLEALGRRALNFTETSRENLRFAAPDDDINYTIMGMLLLEKGGEAFTKKNIHDLWLKHLPSGWTWGPERLVLLKAGQHSLVGNKEIPFDAWADTWNLGEELCGAVIRADAYGYACPGRPALAAELAWRDSSWSHRRTGIYSTMFVAAAIACAQVLEDRLEIFETALKFVPRKSRFYVIAADSLQMVRQADSWMEGYASIHGKYKEYSHCKVYQEIGTLINTLKFAKNVGDGICIQVCQGNDTDSFGATVGSILGAYFGPGHLEDRWLAPFNDRIHTSLADFHENSLSTVAKRMGRLPALLSKEMAEWT